MSNRMNTVTELDFQPWASVPRASASAPTQGATRREAIPFPRAAHGLPIRIEGLAKSFGDRQVLRNVDLQVRPGEFVALVGRSGCGKSTLLRLIAGLEQATQGSLHFDGDARPRSAHPDVRMMFQDPRLLPWKRVADNVALGLDTPDAKQRALEALAQVGLADRAKDWPAVLSGGQRQRVALARALVHQPRLLLLDEPLGALDALTRIEMHALIERLWREQGFTAVLVTHDVGEAVALADRVLLIEEQQLAADERVALARPRSRGDAAFAALEDRVLQRVLRQPQAEPLPAPPAPAWRWAV
jgi:sulfonate transport system ATP-binding protein